jgi:hypothetical protein
MMYVLQNILHAYQLNLNAITSTVCHMNITVMVMMIVEMGVMRWAVKISVMLQHR